MIQRKGALREWLQIVLYLVVGAGLLFLVFQQPIRNAYVAWQRDHAAKITQLPVHEEGTWTVTRSEGSPIHCLWKKMTIVPVCDSLKSFQVGGPTFEYKDAALISVFRFIPINGRPQDGVITTLEPGTTFSTP